MPLVLAITYLPSSRGKRAFERERGRQGLGGGGADDRWWRQSGQHPMMGREMREKIDKRERKKLKKKKKVLVCGCRRGWGGLADSSDPQLVRGGGWPQGRK